MSDDRYHTAMPSIEYRYVHPSTHTLLGTLVATKHMGVAGRLPRHAPAWSGVSGTPYGVSGTVFAFPFAGFALDVAGGAVLLLGFHIADEIVCRASLLAHRESS